MPSVFRATGRLGPWALSREAKVEASMSTWSPKTVAWPRSLYLGWT